MDKINMVKEKQGDKEVTYLRILSGAHEGKFIRVYHVRLKDGVISGVDTSNNKRLVVGKGSVCEEFRKERGLELKKGGKHTDYSSVLEKFNK